MLKDIEELKKFLIWAKSEGLISIKLEGMEFIFNPQAALPPEAKAIQEQYWKAMNDPKSNEMSLDNPLLFDSVKQ